MMKTLRAKSRCPKCDNNEFEVGELYAPGSKLARFLDFQNRKFTSVTCTRCTFTEIYKTPIKDIQYLLDSGVKKF